jgi:hypothetical protein
MPQRNTCERTPPHPQSLPAHLPEPVGFCERFTGTAIALVGSVMRAAPRVRRTLLSIAALVALVTPGLPAPATCADTMPCCDDVVAFQAATGCCGGAQCVTEAREPQAALAPDIAVPTSIARLWLPLPATGAMPRRTAPDVAAERLAPRPTLRI